MDGSLKNHRIAWCNCGWSTPMALPSVVDAAISKHKTEKGLS